MPNPPAPDALVERLERKVAQLKADWGQDAYPLTSALLEEAVREIKAAAEALKPFADEAPKWCNIRKAALHPICARNADECGEGDEAEFTVADLRRAKDVYERLSKQAANV